MAFSICSGKTISFQQGDLRVDGILVSNTYQTGSATLISSSPDTPQTSTSMYLGSHLSSGTSRYYRGLFAFDLSYIKTLAGINPYTIDSIKFNLTVVTANASLPANTLFSCYSTTSFDEATATWNTPGSAAPAGGTIGRPFCSKNVTAVMAATPGSVVSFDATVPGNMSDAVDNALAGDGMLYIMVKQAAENGQSSYYFRPADDDYSSSLGIDVRPELIVDFTVTMPKLRLIVIH
jgi:hypothetical protein